MGKHCAINDNLSVFRAHGGFALPRAFDGFDPLRLNTLSERRQLAFLLRDVDIIWVAYSGWYPIVSKTDKFMVYDKMDDDALLVKYRVMRRHLSQMDRELTIRADYMFATTALFANEAKKYREMVTILPNAVAPDIVPQTLQAPANTGKTTTFGYVGMIDRWFDWEAVQALADANENNRVILVGPNHLPPLRHPRIRYTGRVEKEKLTEYLKSFDVCLYPFKTGRILDSIEPVKIYEYLAMNKPVLAVRCAETEKYGGLLNLYETHRELLALSNSALGTPFPTDAQRLGFVRENNWDARIDEIFQILDSQIVKHI